MIIHQERLKEGSEWGGPHVGCRLKFHYFVGCRLKFSTLLSVVVKFFLVLSVVSNIFSPFVASRLTPFTLKAGVHMNLSEF